MNQVCLRGGIRTTQYGSPSVYLFPSPGENAKDFKHLESEELERVIVDHFNFFRSGQTRGKVHGVSVTVGRTRGDQARKVMNFSAGFMKFTLLENMKANDDSKALLILELPFHDPAIARQAYAAG